MTNPNDQITHHLTYDQYTGKPNGQVEGLTKREYFAAMAMQGLLSTPSTAKQITEQFGDLDAQSGYNLIAKTAVQIADSLIKSLNEQ